MKRHELETCPVCGSRTKIYRDKGGITGKESFVECINPDCHCSLMRVRLEDGHVFGFGANYAGFCVAASKKDRMHNTLWWETMWFPNKKTAAKVWNKQISQIKAEGYERIF